MPAGLASLLRRNRWLLRRRAVQLAILAGFLAGPWFGIPLIEGTLASSRVLGTLPLTDPLILLQSLAARHWPEIAALTGAGIVLAVYALVGGRAYCAWVCPVNLATDLAAWARRRLGLPTAPALDRRLRFAILAGTLGASAATGAIAWEIVNPVTIVQRGLVAGMPVGAGMVLLAVFLFDLGVAARGWCGALCPVGAFYALVGRWRRIDMAAAGRTACDGCGDCIRRCPEPHLIGPALHGPDPAIRSGLCSACGGCAEICRRDVFRFSFRAATAAPGVREAPAATEKEGTP